MKHYSVAALCLLASAALANADISLDISVGTIRDAAGNPAALGSIGILVADIDGDGFAADYTAQTFADASARIDGGLLSAGSLLGGDLVLGGFTVNDDFGFNGFNTLLQAVAYGNGFEAGTTLALLWFPTVFELDAAFSYGTSYGFYTNPQASVASGATMGFVAPADGTIGVLAVFDAVIIGSGGVAVPGIDELTAQAIPEPAAYVLLFGCVAAAAVVRKRRRA